MIGEIMSIRVAEEESYEVKLACQWGNESRRCQRRTEKGVWTYQKLHVLLEWNKYLIIHMVKRQY